MVSEPFRAILASICWAYISECKPQPYELVLWGWVRLKVHFLILVFLKYCNINFNFNLNKLQSSQFLHIDKFTWPVKLIIFQITYLVIWTFLDSYHLIIFIYIFKYLSRVNIYHSIRIFNSMHILSNLTRYFLFEKYYDSITLQHGPYFILHINISYNYTKFSI